MDNCYHLIEKLELLIVVHKDEITRDGAFSLIHGLMENPFLESIRFVLIDIRNASSNIPEEEVSEIGELIYEHLPQTPVEKLAFVAASNSERLKAIDYVHSFKKSSLYQVFSSVEAALNWFKIPVSRQQQVEIKIDYLNKYC